MIYIVLDGLPPSSNQAYFNHPSGGRALTNAGKAYKKEVTNHIVKHHAMQTQELKKNVTVGCVVAFGFPDLFNESWGKKKATSKYKKQDLDNRCKLLQDAIKEATTFDDSQICFDFKYKYQAPTDRPQTTIYLWNEDEAPIGQQLLAAFAAIIRGPGPVQSL